MLLVIADCNLEVKDMELDESCEKMPLTGSVLLNNWQTSH